MLFNTLFHEAIKANRITEGAVVVAQLAERSLSTPEIPDSNLYIGNEIF